MKKLLPILGICTLLVGCSSGASGYDSTVVDGDKVVVEGEDISITKDDVYKYLMEEYGTSQLFDIAMNYIADKEITDEETIQAKVNETIEKYSSYMTDGIDAYAQQAGFENGDEYTEKVLKPDAKQQLLKEKYLDEDFDNIVKDYKVRYIKVITVDTESVAMDIIDKSTSVEAFNDFLDDEDKTGSDVGIVTKENTTVDANIIELLDKFTADGMYSKAIKTSDDKYAVVYVYNTDTAELKDDIRTHLLGLSSMGTDYEVHYLKKYKFEVFENKTKEEIDEINEDYLG
ncbi:MAG: hypothetical protein ACK5LC_17435 [Coprobacillaceae bacterium]